MTRGFGVGVVGLGVMGRTHLRAWSAAQSEGWPCHLVAVSDRSRERLDPQGPQRGNLLSDSGAALFDPARVRCSVDFDEFLATPGLEVVSLCTTTESHVELATRALRAGKHVLVEKPVALTSAEVQRLIAERDAAGRLCMPAFCMRFWPGWLELLEAVRDGRHGEVRSAVFQRLAAPPAWSQDFYADEARSGGALFDLHVHDVDFVHAAFGRPQHVACTGSRAHLTALFRFARGPRHVVAEGGWDHSPGFAFRMRYVVVFERATLDFDFGRSERLWLAREGKTQAVPLAESTGYDGQARHLLLCLREGRSSTEVTLEQALEVTRVLESEAAMLARDA